MRSAHPARHRRPLRRWPRVAGDRRLAAGRRASRRTRRPPASPTPAQPRPSRRRFQPAPCPAARTRPCLSRLVRSHRRHPPPRRSPTPIGTPDPNATPAPAATPTPHALCPAVPSSNPVDLLAYLFNPIFQTMFLVLTAFYALFGDIGIAIIVLTLIIKTILIPLFRAQIVSQRRMQMIQPEIKAIQTQVQGQPHQDQRRDDAALQGARRQPGARVACRRSCSSSCCCRSTRSSTRGLPRPTSARRSSSSASPVLQGFRARHRARSSRASTRTSGGSATSTRTSRSISFVRLPVIGFGVSACWRSSRPRCSWSRRE